MLVSGFRVRPKSNTNVEWNQVLLQADEQRIRQSRSRVRNRQSGLPGHCSRIRSNTGRVKMQRSVHKYNALMSDMKADTIWRRVPQSHWLQMRIRCRWSGMQRRWDREGRATAVTAWTVHITCVRLQDRYDKDPTCPLFEGWEGWWWRRFIVCYTRGTPIDLQNQLESPHSCNSLGMRGLCHIGRLETCETIGNYKLTSDL